MQTLRLFNILLKHELLLAWRQRGLTLQPLLFFVLLVTLVPLALTPDPALLKTVAPGIIWLAALLATLLGLDNLFSQDWVDGSLEQLLLSPLSLTGLVFIKVAAYWLVVELPLLLVTPLLGILLHISLPTLGILLISLLLGTPVLTLIGAMGAALTTGLRHGGILLALVILPLYVPILIFGAGATLAAQQHLSGSGELELLGALLLFTLTLAPLTIATALRISII
ncbi:MAG: heme exporter protein CcmB [Gammaproteobacteria bacterium]